MIDNLFEGTALIKHADELSMKKSIKEAKQSIAEQLATKIATEPEVFTEQYDNQNNLLLRASCFVMTKKELQDLIVQVRDETVKSLEDKQQSVIIKPNFIK